MADRVLCPGHCVARTQRFPVPCMDCPGYAPRHEGEA